jgi:hypothetical protein
MGAKHLTVQNFFRNLRVVFPVSISVQIGVGTATGYGLEESEFESR